MYKKDKLKKKDYLKMTNSAYVRLKNIIFYEKKDLQLKFRIYITGGGCSGFKYNFSFDKKIYKNDLIISKGDVQLLIDHISFQYLSGSIIDYEEKLEGSKFVIINPKAKITCSCGLSFNI